MRIALVNSMPLGKRAKRLYPLALLKIGAWRKSLGDECEIFEATLPQPGEFDEIWITTVFTYHIPYALGLVKEAKKRADTVRVGGTAASLMPDNFERAGAIVHKGLLPDAEKFSPDYSLLKSTPTYSITHTSRGCIRKCKFCMVRTLEPEFKNRPNWKQDLYPGAPTILFYDNNWLAKDKSAFMQDVKELHNVVKTMGITNIDFNQGLDARLMTEKIADALAGLPMRYVRFAFDGKQEDGYYQKAVRMMAARGFYKFTSYVLYNFMDTPEDFYYRLRTSVELTEELHADVFSFPMRYQPIMEIDPKRAHVGKHWSSAALKGFASLRSAHSFGGTISPRTLEQFEYWFGKDAAEFIKTINYPRVRELAQKRKGNLRIKRAQKANKNNTA